MYRTWSKVSWQPCSPSYSDRQMWLNEFKVHTFIMQNAAYKHLGFLPTIFFAPYYIISMTFAKIKNIQTFVCTMNHLAYSTMHTEPPVVPSPISQCGFLTTTEYVLPKALKYGILPQWKPNLKHFLILFYIPLNLANFMPSAYYVSWFLCCHRGCVKLNIRLWY